MPRKKTDKPLRFQNVALLREDVDLLRRIAEDEQRAMARQLSVMIREEYEDRFDEKVPASA